MLESTRKVRAEAFALRKAKKFAEALDVLRPAWVLEKDLVARALMKIDAAYAYAGLKNNTKAAQLLQGLLNIEGLGERAKAAAKILAEQVTKAPFNPGPRRSAKRRPSTGGSSSKSKWTDKPKGNTIWENRESKVANEYFRASQSGDFVRAQRKRLRDLGLDD